jgi:hypothetical protein
MYVCIHIHIYIIDFKLSQWFTIDVYSYCGSLQHVDGGSVPDSICIFRVEMMSVHVYIDFGSTDQWREGWRLSLVGTADRIVNKNGPSKGH